MRTRVFSLLASVLVAVFVYAGSTGTSVHMPQGAAAGRPNGDFVSDNDAGALNTFYRYFIEVPSGITRLQIELFDADIGQGGGTEDTAGRDRTRNADGVTFSTTATYTLLDPNGTAQTTRFTTGDTTTPTGADNAWLDLYNATGNNVLDTFASNVYTRNDGNNNWATNWVETDAGGGGAGGATGGSIQVTGGELRLQDVNAGTQSIYREADLSGSPGLNMGMAFLTFDYRTSNTLEAGDTITLEVSANGGGAWTTLETFADDSSGSRSYDITSFIANNTRIRFTVSGGYTAADEFFFVDNVEISDGPITAGHWELRIDQTAGGIDINAIGIRAHDGNNGSGGTELNVYADSMISLGVNPPAAGSDSRSFSHYPWITSGCFCSQNEFDMDATNAGDQGSVTYSSDGGTSPTFTQSFTEATLSGNDAWNHDDVSGFANDNQAVDYGIWRMADTIGTYTNVNGINGNYETKYVGSYLLGAAGAQTDPTANPIVSGGNPAAFRIYLPTDAGGAPAKPYLEQFITQANGPQGTLPVGVPRTFTISVRIVNPAAQAITFNGTHLITANVPTTGGITYAGGAAASQGSITATPAIGGTGNVTWNPGSLSAGATASMFYNVTITATSAGQRIVATGTPASTNGTRAFYIDETGNTTQSRASYTLGGLCELAVTQGLATEAVVSKFDLDSRGGANTIQFSTASEAGTAGFNIYRENGERVNAHLLRASLRPHGGKYELLDTGNSDPNAKYIIEEVTVNGETRRYGPFNHFEGVDREKRQQEVNASRRFRAEANATMWNVESNAKEKIVAAMVGVPATGIVRVPYTSLGDALGQKASVILKAADKGGIAITNNGTPVSWTSDDSGIYFFADKSTSIYSNDRVYRVELTNGAPMQRVHVTPASTAVSSFTATQELETDSYAATSLPLDADGDYWFWEAFISGDPTYGRKTFNVNVPAVAGTAKAQLNVRLQGGLKDATDHARVSVNGVIVGDQIFKSFDAKSPTFEIPAAVLRDGANEIVVEAIEEGGMGIFHVDGFTVTYQKLARPSGGQIEVRRGGTVSAGPFTNAPMVLDITDRNRASVFGGGSFSGGMVSLNAPASTKAMYFAESFVAPSFVRASYESKLKTSQRVDWVIVAPKGFRTAAESLAMIREREGLRTLVADLEQIYDDFAGGNSTPVAIRDFFKSTKNWSQSPKYFVLAGVGTVNYRGILGAPGPLPPLMTTTPDGIYASDTRFVDWNNDRVPDAAVGRIPVSTPAEMADYVAKIDANSRIDTSTSPIVFSADAVDQSANFKNDSKRVESPLSNRPATHIYVDDLGGTGARNAMMNAWHNGSPLVSWVGHAGLDQLSNAGILTAYDAPDLTSTGRLPVLVAMTCTINRFENGFVDPVGTALTKEDGAGAVAVWSASGLSLNSLAGEIQRTFTRLAAQNPSARMGDLMVQSLAANGSDTSSVYLLLGDPAIKLDLPREVTNGGGTSSSRE